MVLNRRTPIKAKYVFAHLVGAVADVTASQFTSKPFWNFWGFYYGGGASKYIDLGFPEGTLTTGDLPFNVDATNDVIDRLDHIAKDLEITFPKSETEKIKYLGVSNASGAQNSYLAVSEPDQVNVKLTIRGAVTNLMKLSASATTSPTNMKRYNYGSAPTFNFGLAILTTTDISNPASSDAVTLGYFINNCKVISVGDITTIDSEGYAEASFEIEGDASDFFGEYYTAQHSTASNS
jgi:hypothetical protein